MTRKNILVFRELPDDQLARLQAAHEVVVANPRVPTQQQAFEAALPTAQGLIGSSYPIDDALLSRAPQLEVVSSVSVGVDNYALSALHARGITLCHTPGAADGPWPTPCSRSCGHQPPGVNSPTCARGPGRKHRRGCFSRRPRQDPGLLGFAASAAIARRAALGFGVPVLYHARRSTWLQAPERRGAPYTPWTSCCGADFVVAMLCCRTARAI
jgi:gluconate 2-dehydrogenase